MASSRLISKFVAGTKAGPFVRLIGSLDCKGKGTNHDVADVDPVVLCDDSGLIEGAGKPPFGMHPHRGLIAITYILQGSFSDEDNIEGPSEALNMKGGVYAVSAGRGCAHDERTADPGVNRAVQTIVRIPQPLLHLPPQTVKVAEEAMPVHSTDSASYKVVVGEGSPTRLPAFPDFTLLHATVSVGGRLSLPIPAAHTHGYAYVLAGAGEIGGRSDMSAAVPGLGLFDAHGDILSIANTSDVPLEVLVGAGAPLHDEPWVKLLGHNGFIIAESEANAERIMRVIDTVGVRDFSYAHEKMKDL